jgi:hypothetical protein
MAVKYILLHIVRITQYKFVLYFCLFSFIFCLSVEFYTKSDIIFVLVSNAAYINSIMHLTFARCSPPCA